MTPAITVHPSKVLSNLAFAVPASLAAVQHLAIHAILILGVALASMLYHASGERRFALIDRLLAYMLIATNCSLLATYRYPLIPTTTSFVALLIGLTYFYTLRKDDWEWHIACATITTCCLFAPL